ncbi:MAG: DUF1385 domain-containing protein [Clostridiales Family XIII bacterium]|jgi:uncharacterized protein YqhQ|nr:DUF1385 domain-containing protein [Clostridiales Family XIII bacterium]
MDFKRIFIKEACPTKIGGQAVIEGIMMKGEGRTSIVVRLANGKMFIKTQLQKAKESKAAKIPIIRGIVIFVDSMVTGMKTLTYSAEILEKYDEVLDEEEGQGQGLDSAEEIPVIAASEPQSTEAKEPENSKGFGLAIIGAVVIALVFVVGIFIIVPTIVVNFADNFISSSVLLNIFEGLFRIVLFVLYIVLISKMKDIQTVFQFHGAEHQTIHCFEGGLELTPENAETYETLHPRCGTSFLMFVMIISLLLFSLLGWPNLLMRIASRLLLIPIIAGLSYELLKFAGKSDNILVEILSVPGLLLQKLTTRKPDHAQLEVAIAALKAVLVDEGKPEIEGFCDKNGELLPEESGLEKCSEAGMTGIKKDIEEIIEITEETFA